MSHNVNDTFETENEVQNMEGKSESQQKQKQILQSLISKSGDSQNIQQILQQSSKQLAYIQNMRQQDKIKLEDSDDELEYQAHINDSNEQDQYEEEADDLDAQLDKIKQVLTNESSAINNVQPQQSQAQNILERFKIQQNEEESKNQNEQQLNEESIDFDSEMDYIRKLKEKLIQQQQASSAIQKKQYCLNPSQKTSMKKVYKVDGKSTSSDGEAQVSQVEHNQDSEVDYKIESVKQNIKRQQLHLVSSDESDEEAEEISEKERNLQERLNFYRQKYADDHSQEEDNPLESQDNVVLNNNEGNFQAQNQSNQKQTLTNTNKPFQVNPYQLQKQDSNLSDEDDLQKLIKLKNNYLNLNNKIEDEQSDSFDNNDQYEDINKNNNTYQEFSQKKDFERSIQKNDESKNNNINVLQNLKVRDDRTDQFMSRNQIQNQSSCEDEEYEQSFALTHSQLTAAPQFLLQSAINAQSIINHQSHQNTQIQQPQPNQQQNASFNISNYPFQPQYQDIIAQNQILKWKAKLLFIQKIINTKKIKEGNLQKGLTMLYINKKLINFQQSAQQTIYKMQNLSRNFIVANSFHKILQKNIIKRFARSLRKWQLNQINKNVLLKSGEANQLNSFNLQRQLEDTQLQRDQLLLENSKLKSDLFQLQNHFQEQNQNYLKENKQYQQEIGWLKEQLLIKQNENTKMESMFKEYSQWRQKLEIIEQKMKQEIQYWKDQTEKYQKESINLEKEMIKISQEQMKKVRENNDKDEEIKLLKEQMQLVKSMKSKNEENLQTVEEALCAQCKRSMEESLLGVERQQVQSQIREAEQRELIQELKNKISYISKQLLQYQERHVFLETVEKEQKKELESHTDIMLKMEQERLMLIKENQLIKESKLEMQVQNQNYQEKLELFEQHLEDLRKEINQQQHKNKELIESKNNEILDLKQKMEEKQKELSGLQKQKKMQIPQKVTMTGLPQNVVNKVIQKKSAAQTLQNANELKFKTKKQDQMETQSVITQQSTQSTQLTKTNDRQLVLDNQSLTNELLAQNFQSQKLKQELKKCQDQLRKSEKEILEQKKLLESKQNAIDKARKDRDQLWAALSNQDKQKNINIKIDE